MKKTLKALFIACSIALCITLCLTACGETDCSHVYDNDCDETCNSCGQGRAVSHQWKPADCNNPAICNNCGTVGEPSSGHSPMDDDGDCTTAITCKQCGEVIVHANPDHVPTLEDGDCTTATVCNDCHTVITPAKDNHVANEDDGDCTTAITCSHCPTILTYAKPQHVEESDDDDCTTAVVCVYCPTVLIEAEPTHAPQVGDDDCTTAEYCISCSQIAIEAKPNHEDFNEDGVCDNCPYSFGYIYYRDTNTYLVLTAEGLQAALELGGNVTLGANINLGIESAHVPSGVVANFNLAGYTLSGTATTLIINEGELTVANGTISGSYAVLAISGKVKFVGGNLNLISLTAPVRWYANEARIDISQFEGESFKIVPATSFMPLSNVILPEGWALYDYDDEAIEMVQAEETIIAKEEIVDDGVIDTYEELQKALQKGGNVTLGANINIGASIVHATADQPINFDLAGYTLSGTGSYVMQNNATITIGGGTIKGTGDWAIMNYGELTLKSGTIDGTSNAIHNLDGTITVDGGTITSTNNTTIKNQGTLILNGGTITGAGYMTVANEEASIFTMNGGKLIGINDVAVDNSGTLTIKGGTLEGVNYGVAIYASADTVKFEGTEYMFAGSYQEIPVVFGTNDAFIVIWDYAGSSFNIMPSYDNLELSNILLPEGWKLYTLDDEEVSATKAGEIMVAKPAI